MLPVKSNISSVEKYLRHCTAAGKSVRRKHIIESAFKWFNQHADKPYEKMSREDVDNLMAHLEESHYSPWSKYTMKVVFKTFIRWLKDDEYPKEIRGIRLKKPGEQLTKSDLIDYGEFLKVLELSEPWWRTFWHVIYDGNFRVGEALTCKVKHLTIHDNYAELSYPIVQGKTKTGSGTKILTLSVPHLQEWIQKHPHRENPEAPLFMTYYKWEHKWVPITYGASRKALTRAFLKAGYNKRVYHHLFRHSRTTAMYDESYDTTTIERSGGWKKGSAIPRRYEHLSTEDHKRKMLEKAGLAEGEKKTPLRPITCPWCGTLNTAGKKYCRNKQCNRPLDLIGAKEKMEKDMSMLKEMEELLAEARKLKGHKE